jgi:hypothetical protein
MPAEIAFAIAAAKFFRGQGGPSSPPLLIVSADEEWIERSRASMLSGGFSMSIDFQRECIRLNKGGN